MDFGLRHRLTNPANYGVEYEGDRILNWSHTILRNL